MTSTGSLHQTPQPMNKTRLPGRVVLVMQGGGALGSYQAGAYQALHEAGIEPDWVIGTSIGAINGAIIAGNEVVDRVERLQEFWGQLDDRVPKPWGQLAPLLIGVPGFYQVNPALAWGVDATQRLNGSLVSSLSQRVLSVQRMVNEISKPPHPNDCSKVLPPKNGVSVYQMPKTRDCLQAHR
jgi:predicted acylesterase/phospholipase RssA